MADSGLTREQRALRSRHGSYESWSRTVDRSARTAPARAASLARFEKQVDPHGELPEAERATRAEAAKRAWFTALAFKSSRARSKAAQARRQAVELDAEAAAADAELAADAADEVGAA